MQGVKSHDHTGLKYDIRFSSISFYKVLAWWLLSYEIQNVYMFTVNRRKFFTNKAVVTKSKSTLGLKVALKWMRFLIYIYKMMLETWHSIFIIWNSYSPRYMWMTSVLMTTEQRWDTGRPMIVNGHSSMFECYALLWQHVYRNIWHTSFINTWIYSWNWSNCKLK